MMPATRTIAALARDRCRNPQGRRNVKKRKTNLPKSASYTKEMCSQRTTDAQAWCGRSWAGRRTPISESDLDGELDRAGRELVGDSYQRRARAWAGGCHVAVRCLCSPRNLRDSKR